MVNLKMKINNKKYFTYIFIKILKNEILNNIEYLFILFEIQIIYNCE